MPIPNNDPATTNFAFGGPDNQSIYLEGATSGTFWRFKAPYPGLIGPGRRSFAGATLRIGGEEGEEGGVWRGGWRAEREIWVLISCIVLGGSGGISEMSNQTDIDGLRNQLALTIHRHWKLFLIQGIVMMVLGFLAVAEPNVATLAVTLFAGWLFFIGGVFRAASAWHSRQMPGFAWSMLTALLLVALGLILILRPLAGVLTLTMVLVAFFIVEGIASIIGAIEHRRHLRSWGWVLFSGIVDLLLAYLIWAGWPSRPTGPSASWSASTCSFSDCLWS